MFLEPLDWMALDHPYFSPRGPCMQIGNTSNNIKFPIRVCEWMKPTSCPVSLKVPPLVDNYFRHLMHLFLLLTLRVFLNSVHICGVHVLVARKCVTSVRYLCGREISGGKEIDRDCNASVKDKHRIRLTIWGLLKFSYCTVHFDVWKYCNCNVFANYFRQ